MKTTVVEKGDKEGWNDLKEIVSEEASSVTIGLHREDLDTEKIVHAVVNEFGAPEQNIPKRPAHRDAFDEKMRDYLDDLNEMIYDFDSSLGVKRTLQYIGLKHKRHLKSTIQKWNDPPNAELTRRKKGFNDPLIETRETVRSVDFQMEDE